MSNSVEQAAAAAAVQAIDGMSSQKFAYQQAMINLQNMLGTLSGVTEPTETQESELSADINAAKQAFEVLTEDGVSGDELYARTAAVQAVWGPAGVMNVSIDGVAADGTLASDSAQGISGFNQLGNLISYMNEESTGGIDLSQLISFISNATPKN